MNSHLIQGGLSGGTLICSLWFVFLSLAEQILDIIGTN